MADLTYYKAFKKDEIPPRGFILQKDVYTTNLLYANDQFPLTELKKRLPFRRRSMKKQNPNHSVRIIRIRSEVSENSEQKNEYYFKTKQLKNQKLKFPLPKLKIMPLSNLNLYQEINVKNAKIKNIDDDLNITSNNGRKIFYKYKENKLINSQKRNLPSIFRKKFIEKRNNNPLKSYYKRREDNKSMDRISLKYLVGELNNELKFIKQEEIERRKAFIKDKFFSTQIYVENIMDSNLKKKA